MKRSGFKIEEIDKILSQGNTTRRPKINVKLGEVSNENKKIIRETGEQQSALIKESGEPQLAERPSRHESMNQVLSPFKTSNKKESLAP